MTVLDKSAQAIASAPITPSDTVDILDANNRRRIADGIMCSVAGNITYIPADVSEQGGLAATLVAGIAAGIIHPIRAIRVMATGTTATGLTAFFT